MQGSVVKMFKVTYHTAAHALTFSAAVWLKSPPTPLPH